LKKVWPKDWTRDRREGNNGVYTAWLELKGVASPDLGIELDGKNCVRKTLSGLSTSDWKWVNTGVTFDVSSGTHQFQLTGYSNQMYARNVALIANNDGCVPTGNGSNCDTPVTPPPNSPPQITEFTITPTTATEMATFNVSAKAVDSDGTIANVQFQLDGRIIGTDTSGPDYFTSVTGLAAKTYNFVAIATDDDGTTASSSKSIVVAPKPANPAPVAPKPTVSLSSQTYPSSATVTAQPTDDGSIAGVQFYRDGVAVGAKDTGAPFQVSDSLATAGVYNYTYIATDNLGTSTTSLPTQVTVNTPSGTQTGLKMEVYKDLNLNQLVATESVGTINNDWVLTSPNAAAPVDSFSVKWTGSFTVPTTGGYTFATNTDDGVRLFIDDKAVINDWTAHSLKETSAVVNLTAGTVYKLRMEYFESGGHAIAQLYWTGPNITKQIIPESVFGTATTNIVPTVGNLRVTKAYWAWFDYKVDLAWNKPATGNIASYEVTRTGSQKVTTKATIYTQNAIASGLSSNVFQVVAVDASGGKSSPVFLKVTTDCNWFGCTLK
jgi:hypothetical protein